MPVKITPLAQRQVEEEEEEGLIQAKGEAGDTTEVEPSLESRISSIQGGGQPLPEWVRAFFEPRFGHNFSQVRVHTDGHAVESARRLNARAFTVAQNVIFGTGEYAPKTAEGRRLLAHELTHVVQQSGRVQPKLPVSRPGDPFEQEADRVATEMVRDGQHFVSVRESQTAVQRLKEPLPPNVPMPQVLTESIAPGDLAAKLNEKELAGEIDTITLVLANYSAFLEPQELQTLQTTLEELKKHVTPPLTQEQRTKLEDTTKHRIDKAYAAFVSACKDVKIAVAAAVRAQAEMLALLVDVSMGFLVPGLARGIAKLANAIPVEASSAMYRIALAALNQDQVKTSFTAVTKVGVQMIKRNAALLFGESETDAFITQLDKQTQLAFQTISENLSSVSDRELGVTCAMYDANVANVDTYREEVNKLVLYFKVVIEPIKKGEATLVEPPNRAYWVERPTGKRLAILGPIYEPLAFAFQVAKDKYQFVRWVHPSFVDMAIKRMEAAVGKVETVKESQVSGITEGYH